MPEPFYLRAIRVIYQCEYQPTPTPFTFIELVQIRLFVTLLVRK